MKILHTFSKINKKIKKITYEDKNGFYNIRVHLERETYMNFYLNLAHGVVKLFVFIHI